MQQSEISSIKGLYSSADRQLSHRHGTGHRSQLTADTERIAEAVKHPTAHCLLTCQPLGNFSLSVPAILLHLLPLCLFYATASAFSHAIGALLLRPSSPLPPVFATLFTSLAMRCRRPSDPAPRIDGKAVCAVYAKRRRSCHAAPPQTRSRRLRAPDRYATCAQEAAKTPTKLPCHAIAAAAQRSATAT